MFKLYCVHSADGPAPWATIPVRIPADLCRLLAGIVLPETKFCTEFAIAGSVREPSPTFQIVLTMMPSDFSPSGCLEESHFAPDTSLPCIDPILALMVLFQLDGYAWSSGSTGFPFASVATTYGCLLPRRSFHPRNQMACSWLVPTPPQNMSV